MNTLWIFLNSPLFIAVLGTAGAITAYALYKKKIRENKKDAANILLLEIQNAKRQITIAKKQFNDAGENELKMLAEDTFLMPNESWNKYKYLFVRNFDRDEWDAISSFYEKCALFDKAVTHNNYAFPQNAEQLRSSMNQSVTTLLTNYVSKNPTSEPGSQKEVEAIQIATKAHELILSQAGSLFSYSPRKPMLDGKAQLEAASTISLDIIVLKLKKIAHIKS